MSKTSSKRRRWAQEDTFDVTLPSGAVATILRKYKGKHLLQASRMAGGMSDLIRLVFAIIAVRARVNGKKLTIERIEGMAGDDVMILMARTVFGRDETPSDEAPRAGRRATKSRSRKSGRARRR